MGKKKFQDEVLIESYNRLKSVADVGLELGMGSASVWERLNKLGKIIKNKPRDKSVINLTNQRFGRLIALELIRKNKITYWLCQCDCGEKKVILSNNLRMGYSQSCGCTLYESKNQTHGYSGHDRTVEYDTWGRMNARCYNENIKGFKNWGGRGIIVCERWRESFENFLADMGFRPTENHSLDRFPNKNGNYEPTNCRWATPKQQARNKTTNRLIIYKGETKCLAEWAEIFNLGRSTIYHRLGKLKWSIEKTLTTPARKWK